MLYLGSFNSHSITFGDERIYIGNGIKQVAL